MKAIVKCGLALAFVSSLMACKQNTSEIKEEDSSTGTTAGSMSEGNNEPSDLEKLFMISVKASQQSFINADAIEASPELKLSIARALRGEISSQMYHINSKEGPVMAEELETAAKIAITQSASGLSVIGLPTAGGETQKTQAFDSLGRVFLWQVPLRVRKNPGCVAAWVG